MIELSLSFLAWLGVLFIQAMVHVKIVYLKRMRNDSDEPRMIERDSSASSETPWPSKPHTAAEIRRSILSRSESNPALDEGELDFDFDDDDDEPPNLEQRLSQTGTEMMRSCKSLESMVQEQILAPQILAQ